MIPFTTLRKLRDASACIDRYNKHLRYNLGSNYGDDAPITLKQICEINGIDDALWVPEYIIEGNDIKKRYRLFAVACCQNILHLMDDQRSIDAVRISHLYAYNEASRDDLAAARAAARDAARDAAWDAARDAAWDAARDAAWDAAWDAARAAARAAAWDAARDAARDAAWDAARDAAWAAQKEAFLIIFGEEEV